MVPAKLFPYSAGVRLEVLAVGQGKRLAGDGGAVLPIAVPSGVDNPRQGGVARRGHSEPLRMVGPAALPGEEMSAVGVGKADPAVGNPVVGGVGNAVAEEKGCVQLGIHRHQHHPNMVKVGVNAGIVITVALPVVIHTVVAAVGKMQGTRSPMETAVPCCSVIAVGGAAVAAHIHATASV